MVRQTLEAVLLQANCLTQAEQAYLEHLAEYPENGWSLYEQNNHYNLFHIG
jgi:hypothetical protein